MDNYSKGPRLLYAELSNV